MSQALAKPVLDLAASRPLIDDLSPAVVAAFEAQIERTEGCWLWTGEVNGKGYGLCGIPRAGLMMAHRAAYALWRGPIAPGLHVLHSCDVKRCVRPDHLWLGTNADNHADKIRKGRNDSAFGAGHGRAKLSEREATAVHRLVKAGVERRAIAVAFGISPATVSRIGDGSRWQHIALIDGSN